MAGAGERTGRLSVVAKRLRADYFSLKKTDSESDDLLSPTFLGANSEPLCAGASAIRARNFTGMQHAKLDLSTLLTKRWNVLEFKQGTGDGAGNCGRAVGRLLKAKIHQQGGRQAVRGCDARMLPFLQECRSRSGAAGKRHLVHTHDQNLSGQEAMTGQGFPVGAICAGRDLLRLPDTRQCGHREKGDKHTSNGVQFGKSLTLFFRCSRAVRDNEFKVCNIAFTCR